MRKKQIIDTAICYWSDLDESYVVESPFGIGLLGVGTSEAEARRRFLENVEETFAQTGAVGGPYREVKLVIDSRTESALYELKDRLGCSLGEALTYMSAYYRVAKLPKKPGEA